MTAAFDICPIAGRSTAKGPAAGKDSIRIARVEGGDCTPPENLAARSAATAWLADREHRAVKIEKVRIPGVAGGPEMAERAA